MIHLDLVQLSSEIQLGRELWGDVNSGRLGRKDTFHQIVVICT